MENKKEDLIFEKNQLRNKFLPEYLFVDEFSQINIFKRMLFWVLKKIIQAFIWIVLNPRKDKVGELDEKEVERVYNREARFYDWKHHMTTRGQDLKWRRSAAQFVLNCFNNSQNSIVCLDLCTGTGLTAKEIDNIFHLNKVEGLAVNLIGLDYNEAMLSRARKKHSKFYSQAVQTKFVRGDATALTQKKEGFVTIDESSVDVVTNVFGIGGIKESINNLEEVLKVLKIGGLYYIYDMHKPIKELAGEICIFGFWFSMPYFEKRVYEEITMPLVLGRLWGWRDTTMLFYLINFVTYHDKQKDMYYGFKKIQFNFTAERWWASLPIMPVASIIIKKEELSKIEAQKRAEVLQDFL